MRTALVKRIDLRKRGQHPLEGAAPPNEDGSPAEKRETENNSQETNYGKHEKENVRVF